jgi:hypothetical protein
MTNGGDDDLSHQSHPRPGVLRRAIHLGVTREETLERRPGA